MMASPPVRLSYAGEVYDRTAPLAHGLIRPAGVELSWLRLAPAEAFLRMLRERAFDASEMSCANHFMLCSQGDRRFVAIPVFPSRLFRHSAIYLNTAAHIRSPEELKGRRVGCPDYTMTMAVWVRGFLQHDYGVLPSDLTWVQGGLERPGWQQRFPVTPPPGVQVEQAPPDRSLVQLLEAGEIEVLLAARTPSVFRQRSPRVARLFPDFRAREVEYFQHTGVFPIMHTVVLQREIYERAPGLAVQLFEAFSEARRLAVERLEESDALAVSLAWTLAYAEQERAILGPDPWAYGFARNRPALELLKRYLLEQGLLEQDFALEEAFAPNTLDAVDA